MKAHKLIIRAAVCLIVLSYIFSFAFIIGEAHHDCTGEECVICRTNEVLLSQIRNGFAGAQAPLILLSFTLFTVLAIGIYTVTVCMKSQVELKVRLIN